MRVRATFELSFLLDTDCVVSVSWSLLGAESKDLRLIVDGDCRRRYVFRPGAIGCDCDCVSVCRDDGQLRVLWGP